LHLVSSIHIFDKDALTVSIPSSKEIREVYPNSFIALSVFSDQLFVAILIVAVLTSILNGQIYKRDIFSKIPLRHTLTWANVIGIYTLVDSEGGRQTVGDIGATFIDGNSIKTVVYDVEPMPEGRITVDVFVIYGESKFSLEKEIRISMEVDTIRVLDECQLDLDSIEVSLNPRSKTFSIEVANIGEVDCYVHAEIFDLRIAGEETTHGLAEVERIETTSKAKLRIKINELEQEDIDDNKKINVRLLYGERKSRKCTKGY